MDKDVLNFARLKSLPQSTQKALQAAHPDPRRASPPARRDQL